VDTLCWAVDASLHGRIHRVRSSRRLSAIESGFALGLDTPGDLLGPGNATGGDRAVLSTTHGCSAIIDLPQPAMRSRRPIARNLAVNASLVWPRTAVPALESRELDVDSTLAALVYANPADIPDRTNGSGGTALPNIDLVVPIAALGILDRISAMEAM
jgi:hypothetical protein